MIVASQIQAQYDDMELSPEEQKILSLMEEYTDAEIKRQFPKSLRVYIKEKEVRAFAKDLGYRREDVIFDNWMKRYIDNGWTISPDPNYYDLVFCITAN